VGLTGLRVDDPEQVGDAWDRALAADRPVVLEAITDLEVPPLPPHITLEQARALTSALLHGDPSRGQIVKQAARQKLEEFLPGR
jgi:pyruvate dehydrogenase (quinone)